MAIDPAATPKDYTLIIYNKNEIDAHNAAETSRVNGLLSEKSLKTDEGSPSGISTLDPSGKVNIAELPMATLLESDDSANNSTIITPERLHYQLGIVAAEHTYDYNTVSGHVVTNDIYEETNRLITPIRPGGIYEMKLSMIWTLDNKNASAFFRFSEDGGTTWTEFILEPSPLSDKIPETLIFPLTHVDNTSMDIVVQARKQNAVDTMTVDSLHVIFESKVLD